MIQAFIAAFAATTLFSSHANHLNDKVQIKAMQGCYEVTFQFEETGTVDPAYPVRSKPYFERGLEWIEVDFESDSTVALQQILLTPQGPLKHWRQTWEFQPMNRLDYLGDFTWRTSPVGAAESAGKWIQRVDQVDDSPRYECVAAWVGSAWQCTAFSPLPRREFVQRSDYQILNRTNRHVIVSDGWLHEQNSEKVKLDGTVVAFEKGVNTYKRVESSRCAAAKTYWAERKSVWNTIQDMWDHIKSHHAELRFHIRVDGKVLWERLFQLADEAYEKSQKSGSLDQNKLSADAHDLIHVYLK